jgi:hypothetical protein
MDENNFSYKKVQDPSKTTGAAGCGGYACNLSIWVMVLSSRPALLGREFKVSLSYVARPCFKNQGLRM